jgi:segregation and condensation protein B
MSVEATSQDEKCPESGQNQEEIVVNEQSDAPAAESSEIELDQLLAPIEAMLVSSDRPLKPVALIDAMGVHLGIPVKDSEIAGAVEQLNAQYVESGRAFTIEHVSGGYRMMTRPEHAPVIAAMHRCRASTRLSKPALETLAIIAYRQPITRAELEAIRGVACGEVVRSLMDRRLVKITGRAEELGRPMLYGTTTQFLDTFGLANVKDLPKPEEFADQMVQQGV